MESYVNSYSEPGGRVRFPRLKKNAPNPVREGSLGLLWYPMGAKMFVGRQEIRGGLLYLRDPKSIVEGFAGMIELGYRVGSSQLPAFQEEPSIRRLKPYREFHVDARARYFQWLSDGRNAPTVEPAFVLNYFCGLERRVFQLLRHDSGSEELLTLAAEIRRLSTRYASHEGLADRSERLLQVLAADPGRSADEGPWKFSGGPRTGQRTYEALFLPGTHVHYDASETVQAAPGQAAEQEPAAPDEFLDLELVATRRQDTAATDLLLNEIFDDEGEPEEADLPVAVTVPEPIVQQEITGQENTEQSPLPQPLLLLLSRLAEKDSWSRGEASDQARELGLMLDAALTEINEHAEERREAEVVYEDEGRLMVDAQILTELALPSPTTEPESPPVTEPAPATSAPTATALAVDSVQKDDVGRVGPPRWISSMETVRVQGRSVSGGVFYFGVPAEEETRLEVINPLLPAKSVPETGAVPDGPTAYADLSTSDRAAFLDWLADGRSVSSARESFLFLLLHGLEHRALVDLKPWEYHRTELTELLSHIRFLISVHVSHEGFTTAATSFAAVLERLVMDQKSIFSTANTGKMPQQVLQFKLGMYTCTGRPLPLELVVLWVRAHPYTAKNSEVQRSAEFHRAFRRHFVQVLPKGLRLPQELPDLTWAYQPAHPYLGAVSVPTAKAKKVWDHFPTLQTLGAISRRALDECAKNATDVPKQPANRRWSTWKSPGTEVRIAGMIIPDGMLYTGYGPGEEKKILDLEGASALDTRLRASVPTADTAGVVPSTVRGYADLTPQQRGHYLRWLKQRDRTKGVPPVFVRLYIQGLERRIVDLLGKSNPRIQNSNPVLDELRRLHTRFSAYPEIVAYTEGLLNLVGAVQALPPKSPPRYTNGVRGVPFALLHGLGAIAAGHKPLPMDWVVEWLAHHIRPDDPEAFRANVKRALAGARFSRRIDREVTENLPDLVLAYRSRCPGLGELDVVLDGVPDLTDVDPPQEFLDRVSPIAASAVAQAVPPTVTSAAEPSIAKPEPGCSKPLPWLAAWARLAVEMSRHSGQMTARHRIAVIRGVQELGDLSLAVVRQWKLQHMEDDDGTVDLETQVRTLLNVRLRQRERAADLLLDLSAAQAAPEQLSFLMAVHQGLGLDAVLRLRLSYRGLAPDPSDNGVVGAFGKPRRSTRHRTAEPTAVDGLSPVQARLMADLGQAASWSQVDVDRLAAWYGMEADPALRALNAPAVKLIGRNVFVPHGDSVAVSIGQVKEMTT